MGDEDESDLPEAAHRELAARRRDLEREFDLKMRDLKAQHSRRMDRMEQEKAEWEADRRAQAKELADRKETVRRRTENAEQRVETSAAEKQELAALRADVRRLEGVERAAKKAEARHDDERKTVELRVKAAIRPARWAAVLLVVGTAGWLAAGRATPLALAVLTAGLAAAVLLSLAAGRIGLPRDPLG
ncbi:MAG: hypothetical protein V4510_11765 [bacterium]